MSQQEVDLRKLAEGRVGRVLNQKWSLDRLIDVGGMAAVYAATHRNGNRVAVKVLHPTFPKKSNVRERFLREGYLANKVGHPGAVSVLDDDTTEDGMVFLVMELLEGESLEGLLQRAGGLLGWQHVLAVADQVLDVFAAAHDRGVIHRDIKPANLFLTKEGQVKVLDFGLARLKESDPKTALTGVGVVMGTTSYMPPEQARGKWDLIDGRTDLFALGAVMFRCLSGRVVHEADSPADRMVAAMTRPARSLGTVAPLAPAALVHVVDTALSFEMNNRWPDAHAMQRAVRQVYALLAAHDAQPDTRPAAKVPAASGSVDVQFSSKGSDGASIQVDLSDMNIASRMDLPGDHALGIDDMLSIPPELMDRLPEVSAILVEDVLSRADIVIEPHDGPKGPKK